jgi:hypothetical protein
MVRWRDSGRGAAVWLAAAGASAIVAAREAWTIGAGGALLVAAVVVWRRSPPLGIARIDVPWRRVAVTAGLLAALVVVAKLAGAMARDESEAAGGASRHYGRHLLPPLPAGDAAYAATLRDGTEVHAWRMAPATLHVRVDVAAARCSGGAWREWWHMADFPRLRVAAGGAFAGTGGYAERRAVAVHTAAFAVRGVVARGILRGTLVRTDRYRGRVDGVCRRTVRFAAGASGRGP